LAAELGIKSYGHVADMENGRTKPSVDLLIKIADLFDVTIDQLLRDDQEIGA
jgi:transcriptional regulator with XRE-family HTH domain